jgi:1,2-phenylacetyl-CoA epoxidase PaaB subunit
MDKLVCRSKTFEREPEERKTITKQASYASSVYKEGRKKKERKWMRITDGRGGDGYAESLQ